MANTGEQLVPVGMPTVGMPTAGACRDAYQTCHCFIADLNIRVIQ